MVVAKAHSASTFNNHKSQHDKEKITLSSVSLNIAMSLYKQYSGVWGLQEVDVNVIPALKVEIGGEDLMRFVSPEYAAHAQAIYNSLGITKLEFNNI